ncbi:MAG TPA: hypothetical protein VJ944_02060, partial [Thermoplasmataceae archaeon]|nr:hypothetical protein [Thermoplasmataceae archaeon]
MELLVLIGQGVDLIKIFPVRVGYNRRVNYVKRWGMGIPRSGSVLIQNKHHNIIKFRRFLWEIFSNVGNHYSHLELKIRHKIRKINPVVRESGNS